MDFYAISESGKVIDGNLRHIKDADNGKGYRYITLRVDQNIPTSRKNRKNYYIHRLVALAFLKKKPGKNDVNHKDGNKANNHFLNLEWCDKFENMKHAYRNGLLHNPSEKLTDNEVFILKSLFANGVERQILSKCFGIGLPQICRILKKQNRADI